MPVSAVVGANWGDEGKGKITDVLGADADFVVRFQGGSNAGHTIINEYGKFALHLLPSGVFHDGVINVLGPGVAVDIRVLLAELESLRERGVPQPEVRISDRAQIVLPYHRLLDECEEERLGARQFGSTRAGIAPFYRRQVPQNWESRSPTWETRRDCGLASPTLWPSRTPSSSICTAGRPCRSMT